MKKEKTCHDSGTVMTQLIMPNDTNFLGNLMGGNLMKWMDVAGAMSAMRHCNNPVVTAAVDHVSFERSIPLGAMVILEAIVTRVFHSSLEVYIEVFKEDLKGERIKCNEAFFTFVSVDSETRLPVAAPKIHPETARQKHLFDGALNRRELRLVMAGRIKPEQAKNLKNIFNL